jgi:RimJ/RimL family protein N-acetyltransferase
VAVSLRDGGLAALRPLDAGHEAALVEVFGQLSPTSRANRYLVGLPVLTRSMISALVAVDGHDHVAWLASVEGRPVGIARYVRTRPAQAEIALEVADAHQGRGLGTALLDTITTLACVNGIRRLEAIVLPDNRPSLRLLARIGVPLLPCGPTLEGSGPLRLLDPACVDRAAVVALAARSRVVQSGRERAWTTAARSGH